MKRIAASMFLLTAWLAPGANAATLCVGSGAGCYAQLQPAVDAASDGDAITIGKGTFRGGVTIDKSLDITGFSARSTAIRGGGPVLTIGTPGAASEPTVTLAKLRVTGGVTRRGVEGPMVTGVPESFATGGGISIPPGKDFSPGATVTITDSTISENSANPTAAVPSGLSCGAVCPFAIAAGGGISTWGPLTVRTSTVFGNVAGGDGPSDAIGGGVAVLGTGGLTLDNTKVIRNIASAAGSRARFAEGGGVFTVGATLAVDGVRFSDNQAVLDSSVPLLDGNGDFIDGNGNSGAIHIGDGVAGSIANVRMDHNLVRVINERGGPVAFDSAMFSNSNVTLEHAIVDNNGLTARTATAEFSGGSGSVLEFDGGGTVRDLFLSRNQSFATATNGVAAITGALTALGGDIAPLEVEDAVIQNNVVSASSTTGPAFAQGAGVLNGARIAFSHSAIRANRGSVATPGGSAQGGGISNSDELSGPSDLSLDDVVIAGNRLTAPKGTPRRGGGLFTTFPFTATDLRFFHNAPDDCFGCASPFARAKAGPSGPAPRRTQSGRPSYLR